MLKVGADRAVKHPIYGPPTGDDYNQRFGTHVDCTRLICNATFYPGNTAASASAVRATLFRAQSNTAFAANMADSYSPIADNTVTQVLMDKFFQIGPSAASQQWPSVLRINKKLKHRQKFTGSGTSSTTGECLYFVIQSERVAGTTAPIIGEGQLELYFKP